LSILPEVGVPVTIVPEAAAVTVKLDNVRVPVVVVIVKPLTVPGRINALGKDRAQVTVIV
jgi:hypothetical protein